MLRLIISLPMMTTLFWLLWFMLSYRQSDSARRMMTYFFLASFVLYMMHYLYFSGTMHPVLETVYGVCNLLVYPLFWFYIIRLAGKKPGKEYWWLLPAVVLAVFYTLSYVFDWQEGHRAMYITARLCFAAEVVYTAICGPRLLNQLRESLDEQYSDDRSNSLRPVVRLVVLFAIISILAILSNLIGREWFAGKSLVAVPAALMSVLLYLLGYVTSRLSLPESVYQLAEDVEETGDDANHNSERGQFSVLLRREDVERVMTETKPFTNPNFTLTELAGMLYTNRTYLSSYLRTEMNMNFASFVNMYRVDEAKKILTDRRYKTFKEAVSVALAKTGFSFESTFYRSFKQFTGMTPAEWRRKQLEDEETAEE